MREVVVVARDDLDHTLDADVLGREIGFDGKTFVLDLTQQHDDELVAALKPFLDAAHEVRRHRRRQAGSADMSRPAATREIRQWASRQPDLKVHPYGALSRDVIEAYRQRSA